MPYLPRRLQGRLQRLSASNCWQPSDDGPAVFELVQLQVVRSVVLSCVLFCVAGGAMPLRWHAAVLSLLEIQ